MSTEAENTKELTERIARLEKRVAEQEKFASVALAMLEKHNGFFTEMNKIAHDAMDKLMGNAPSGGAGFGPILTRDFFGGRETPEDNDPQ